MAAQAAEDPTRGFPIHIISTCYLTSSIQYYNEKTGRIPAISFSHSSFCHVFLLRTIALVPLSSNCSESVEAIPSSSDKSASHLCGKASALLNTKIEPWRYTGGSQNDQMILYCVPTYAGKMAIWKLELRMRSI